MDKYTSLLQLPILGPQEIFGLVLASEGVKPVAAIQPEDDPEQISTLSFILESFGLFVCAREVDCLGAKISLLSASLSEDLLRSETELDDAGAFASEVRFRRYGNLFGYPFTAVEGFVAEEMVESEEVLPGIFNAEDLWFFLLVRPFRLSKNNWRNEACAAQKWMNEFRAAAPNTYQLLKKHPGRKIAA